MKSESIVIGDNLDLEKGGFNRFPVTLKIRNNFDLKKKEVTNDRNNSTTKK